MIRKLTFLLFLLTILGESPKAVAHATKIEYEMASAVRLRATHGNQEPLIQAQVVVYAPNNPSTPWQTGTTDSEGYFSFFPDFSAPGDWKVTIRQAGHGGVLSIPVPNSPTPLEVQPIISAHNSQNSASLTSDYTSLEKVLLSVAGVWGFVGTTLFFARGRRENHPY